MTDITNDAVTGTTTPSPTPAALPALPAELTIEGAAALHRQWLAWWVACHDDAQRAVCIDASAVDAIDGSGLQLLLSLRKLLARHDRTLVLAQPSDVVRGACRAMGAESLLEAA